MKYAGIIKNDICAGKGICVTFFTQGCPHHCPGCHNPETWDFLEGKEFTPEILQEVIKALQANGIHRDLCIMGGEPLCGDNQFLTLLVISTIKEKLPGTKVYIWTGYEFTHIPSTSYLPQILDLTDVIVDGPYLQEERDITLPMRGSRNQKILYKSQDF